MHIHTGTLKTDTWLFKDDGYGSRYLFYVLLLNRITRKFKGATLRRWRELMRMGEKTKLNQEGGEGPVE